MRRLLLALLLTASAFAPAQLIDSGVRPTPIGFSRFHWGFAPNSTVPGVSILRTQEALDAFWSANNGRPGLKGAIAPWKPDFKQGQLIAIVLPKELRFDAWPMVTNVEQVSCWRWHIEVAPTPGTVNPGIGVQVPFVIVRTPFGPNAVDVVIRDPEGKVVETIRTTN